FFRLGHGRPLAPHAPPSPALERIRLSRRQEACRREVNFSPLALAPVVRRVTPWPMTATGYTFAGVDRGQELARLRSIESIFDPASRRLLEDAGATRGALCLEIGAGAGSIAAWLAERAGDAGEVTALDLDTSFLRASGPPSRVRVVEGDARHADLPAGHFDVAHARYVLVHNADWEALV